MSRGPVVVSAIVILTNLPSLAGIVHADPRALLGGMSTNGAGFLPGEWFNDPNIGWTAQALGHRAALDWLHGHVPWWNPFEGIGSPLAAEMQSAAFFPPVLLFALPNGSVYFHVTLELVAGIAMWCLVRELGCSRVVAIVGGVLFALNGTFSWLTNASMNPIAFLPLLVLGIERAFRREGIFAGVPVMAFALALSIYAGFPEVAYLDTLVAVAWAILRLVQSPPGDRFRFAVKLALGSLVGLLISLPLVIPFLEYLPHAFVGLSSGTHPALYLSGYALAVFGLPYLYGPLSSFWGSPLHIHLVWARLGGFVTTSTIVIAVAGLIGRSKDRGLRTLLGIIVVLEVAWSFDVPGVTSLDRVVPLIARVQFYRDAPPSWEFALIVLACFGLDTIGNRGRARGRILIGCAVMAGLVVAILVGPGGGFVGTLGRVDHLEPGWAVATALWTAAIVVVLALFGKFGAGVRLVRAAGLVLVLDAVVMAALPQLSAPRSVTFDDGPINFLRAHLGQGRYFSLGADRPDYGSFLGLAQLNSVDLPVPAAWVSEVEHHLAPHSPPANFDGVTTLSNGAAPLVQVITHIGAYENLDVRYLVVPRSNAIARKWPPYPDGLRRVFHDASVTILSLPDPRPYFSTALPCRLVAAGPNRVTASCRRPTMLVRSELALAGWSVSLNGRPAHLVRSGGLLTAVHLPAGTSIVVFSYVPPHVTLALLGFGIGILLLGGLPLAERRRRQTTGTLSGGHSRHNGRRAGQMSSPSPAA